MCSSEADLSTYRHVGGDYCDDDRFQCLVDEASSPLNLKIKLMKSDWLICYTPNLAFSTVIFCMIFFSVYIINLFFLQAINQKRILCLLCGKGRVTLAYYRLSDQSDVANNLIWVFLTNEATGPQLHLMNLFLSSYFICLIVYFIFLFSS